MRMGRARFMSPSPTCARRPMCRWLPRLLVAILILIPPLAPSAPQAQKEATGEITSKDVQPTFKLQAQRNVVVVRVVVRDAHGAAVENLRQEDFQLFDRGKQQTILSFSLEKPSLKAAAAPPPKAAEKPAPGEGEETDETSLPASTPSRFVGLYFDDVNTVFTNLAQARDAADRFLTKHVQPGDRVALYTSSGQKQLDFTDDVAKIHQALMELRERPIIGKDTSCGAIAPYQAYQIVDQNDSTAIAEAAEEIYNCNPCPPQVEAECRAAALTKVQSEATRSLTLAETQSNAALRGIESLVRRMTALPGQRSVVVISEGFLSQTLLFELSQISDRALRSGVIINAIDARGLYTDPTNDASQGAIANTMNAAYIGQKHLILMQGTERQTEGIESLALDTGGIFFHNSNDLDDGFRRVAAAPESYYVLTFSPQNLKLDGLFHPLRVKLPSYKALTVQARKGYFAPRKPEDAAAQEKEELQDAVYSQEETHELPIDVHTQFFMKNETDARLAVLTSIDVRLLHFRKEDNRNVDNLTFVAVVFDRDGNVVTGEQKALQLRLRDNSLERYQQTGITIRTMLDVHPGTYLVRAVVRDSESGQISGLNRTVEIPY